MAIVVTGQASDPVASVEPEFEFLATDFGFLAGDVRRERGGFELRYAKGDLGILINWYPRDPLTVWLVRLVDGAFSPRGQAVIRADSTLYYFDLGHLEAFADCDRTPQTGLYTPSSESAHLLARSLRTCGEPILLGDTRKLDALQEYVKERARQVTIAYYGEEYARTLGW
jgi:hypothetical protein